MAGKFKLESILHFHYFIIASLLSHYAGNAMRKKWILLIFKISIAVIALIFVIKKVRLDTIYQTFQSPPFPFFIIPAFILLIPNLFLQWTRWHFLLRLIQPKVNWKESCASLFGGMVAGFLTPGRIGEVSRSLFLTSCDRLQAAGLFFLDRLYTLIVITIGGFWGIVFLLTYLFDYAGFILWPLCVIGLIVTSAGFWISLKPGTIRSFFYLLSLVFPSRDGIKRFISGLDLFKKEQGRPFFIWTILMYCIYIAQFCLLSFSFQKIPWTTAVTATTCTMFAKTLLPISFADLGIREGASVYFFLKFNVEKVTAFNSALLLFVINVVMPTIVGLFFLPKMKLKNNDT